MSSRKEKKSENTKAKSKQPSAFSSIGSLVFIVVLVFAFKSSILDANNIPSGSMIPTLKIGDFLFVNKMRYSIRMPFTEKEIFRIDNPKRGDIITFIPPATALSEDEAKLGMFSKRFVKRVVGMPGDTIRITKKTLDTTKGKVDLSFIEYKESGATEFQNYKPTEISRENELNDLDNPEASKRALFLEEKNGFKHFTLEGYDDDRKFHVMEYCDFRNGCTIPPDRYMVVGDNRDDSHDSRAWGFVSREDILGKALIIYFSIDWKDNVCMYKNESEIAEKGTELTEKYEGADLLKKCHPYEISPYGFRNREESKSDWVLRTLQYRIWRMSIRWKRIGRILQ
ncbi:MAG: signal peptidase I [Leptospiraceae bacterium]|nr:signal peptidase I [Leptospiraceae bacterium]MCK6381554.1 signal peptidase I [Leptospiraceae bacterium]NUM41378.1 signal peptidase I [Leptospiraceae bacterium]